MTAAVDNGTPAIDVSGSSATGCAMLDVAMHVDVMNTVLINRLVADVSEYAADPNNAPLWYENIKSVEWKTPPPTQVGSRIDFVAHFLGRRLAYTYEVIELVPGRRLTMRTPGPPFPMETTYERLIARFGGRVIDRTLEGPR